MKKIQPTDYQKKQLAALDAIRDADIDLSDIPDQAKRSGWVRASMPQASHAGYLHPSA